VVGKEAAAVLFVKCPCESPLIALQRSKLQDLDLEQVAWLGSVDGDRPCEIVHL
jgi:hypothetical protein